MSLIKSLKNLALTVNKNHQSSIFTSQIRNASNRSKRGLYDGKDIRTGNNVPFSLKKTKRKFKPNVFKKRLYSEILNEMIQFHVTTSALRTIDKVGGLDQYLLKKGRIKPGNNEGWKVRERILAKIRDCKNKGIPILDDVVFTNEFGEVKDLKQAKEVVEEVVAAQA